MYNTGLFFDMLDKIGQIRDVKVIRQIAAECSDNQSLFNDLFEILIHGNERERKMSSWAVSTAVEYNEHLISDEQHLKLLASVEKETSGTIIRNVVRTWQFAKPKEVDVSFQVVEYCLKQLIDVRQEIAIRAFAITVLERHIDLMPEIKEEVVFILEKELPLASPAFLARARRYLKKVEKLERQSKK